MARPRINDPIGTSDNPHYTSDPSRLAELMAEFLPRLEHIRNNYILCTRYLESKVEFNASLTRLQSACAKPKVEGATEERLHPELELVISHFARKFAAERAGKNAEPVQADVERAARRAVKLLSTRKGAPGREILRHHVEALVALVQEFSGKPVLALRQRNGVYDPHFADGISQLVPTIFQSIDSKILEGTLARMVLDARKQNAGRPLRFTAYFPLYGAQVRDDGAIMVGGMEVGRFEDAFPIYCPN